MEFISKRVTLSAIDDSNKRYQVRDDRAGTFNDRTLNNSNSQRQIKTLINKYREGKKVDKIEVVEEPVGSGKYIIFHGFHRYAAMTKINKKDKGTRFKQITVHVVSKENADNNVFELNREHNAIPLAPSHTTEADWQKFLQADSETPRPSKAQIHAQADIPKSTIGKWRREKKQFEEAGFFRTNSGIEKNEVTGFPLLKPSRDALRRLEDERALNDESEASEGLNETDQKALADILKLALKSKDQDKLLDYINYYWGENPSYIDASMELPSDDF